MKSHESDQMEVLRRIYVDACSKCTADVSDERDLIHIRKRVEEEGLSFLTITLPGFAKDFDKSLATGYIDSTSFRAFRKYGAIPAFLQGMLSHLFDIETGRLLDAENPLEKDSEVNLEEGWHRRRENDARRALQSVIVEAVRQVCRAFAKIEIACTPERVATAIEGFVSTERDLAEFSIDDETRGNFVAVARYLWDVCLSGFTLDDTLPKHGPGTTADRRSGNRKFRWVWWHERLEPYFPFLGSAYSVHAAGEQVFEMVEFASVERELPVKVTPVPKTQKGPRIIAIEPACMQYAQGALQTWLYRRIATARMSRGHVNFSDQSINQREAMIASITGERATIDLSDASDRVPLSLVKDMFLSALGDRPLLWEAIEACRSTHAELPGGTVIGPLRKFASMGSALCFPVEAMYFYTSCVEALLAIRGLPVTRENVYNVSRLVHVYGDDLLIPSANAVAVIKHLAKYNCKVNLNKSFWNGKFRESCGLDAFRGEDVTPIYVRRLIPDHRRQDDVLISTVETANSFYKKGYWTTAQLLYERVERHLGRLPFVGEDSSLLGRITFMGGRSVDRWNPLYQRFEAKGWSPVPVHRTDELGDYPALQKSLLRLESNQSSGWVVPKSVDALHLERTARYGVATLKRRWAPA